MKNIKNIVIVLETLLLMIFSLVGCGGNNKNTYSLPDVAVGDTFEITLSAYGSTPYQWNYEISPTSGIEYVSQEFVQPDDDRVGGGELVYTFKGITIGNYKIKFERRSVLSESKNDPPIKANIYEVAVVKERSTDVVNAQNFDLSIM